MACARLAEGVDGVLGLADPGITELDKYSLLYALKTNYNVDVTTLNWNITTLPINDIKTCVL